MRKSYLFFAAGLLSLLFAYGLFNGDQYFSGFYMSLILILVFVSASLLVLAYMLERDQTDQGKGWEVSAGIALSVFSALIVLLEANFAVFSEPISSAALKIVFGLVFLAAATTIIAYLISIASTKKKGIPSYLIILFCVVVASAIIGIIEFQIVSVTGQQVGTDEMAFDYFAASLLLHGINPYAANFSFAVSASGVWPTQYLNGTCECRYIYPPLAFVSLAPFALAITTYQNFLPVDLAATAAILLAVFVFLFRNRKNDITLMLPVFVIALSAFFLAPWGFVKYLAMAVALLAYVLRKRAFAYPVLMGIAASLHEIAWVVVPFFLLSTAMEDGVKRALEVALVTLVVFLATVSVFFIASPSAMLTDLHSVTNMGVGVTLMQFLISFYPLSYDSISLFPFIVYALMVIAYASNSRYRAVMCVAATVMFFFWIYSDASYTIAFMPLLIYIIAEKEDGIPAGKEILPRTRIPYLPILAALVAILLIAAIIQGHEAYAGTPSQVIFKQINTVTENQSDGTKTLVDLDLLFKTASPNETTAAVRIISIRPTSVKTLFVKDLNGGSENYSLVKVPMELGNITNSTRLKMFISVDHYGTSLEDVNSIV